MKLIVSFIAVLYLTTSFAQTQTNVPTPAVQHFAQCMFSITDQTQLDELTVEFYNNLGQLSLFASCNEFAPIDISQLESLPPVGAQL